MKAIFVALAVLVAAPAFAQEYDSIPAETGWALPGPWENHFVVGAGGVFHELYGISYGSAQVFARYGSERRHFGVYCDVMVEAGAALPRLPIEAGRVGFQLLYRNQRFRAGAGVRLGGLALQRVTDSSTAPAFALSVYVMGSVDLYRWSKHAVFLGAELGFEVLAFSSSSDGETPLDFTPMATLQLGVRY